MTMNLMIRRICVAALTLRAFVCPVSAAVNELAHYNLPGADGLHATTAPEIWKSQAPGGPDLAREGSPKIMNRAPAVAGSAIKFEQSDQCYSVAKNLVSGDNFVLEAWAFASKDNDNGWHSVVANGNGGTGFLLAQNDDQWSVLVGGVGAVSLGEVQSGAWTHLAIVKSQGQVTGWLNGEKVADVPDLGGGAANFSIGATAPGREAFNGLVSEVRYSTIENGTFDPATDFLPGAKHRTVVPVKMAESAKPVARRAAAWTFQTQKARLGIDNQGFITSLVALKSGQDYSPAAHPSPLMSLHEYGQPNEQLISPISAVFDGTSSEITLKYPNDATAVVKAVAKENYFRFQLVSLSPRGNVDNIVWGPLHTTISGKIGDLIGVVRDEDWAIGMLGLDDNTITGPVEDGDCYEMGYYVHSPDPAKYPVPRKYQEGQWFNIGGDGVSDTAFYSHPEEYFNQVFGSGAKVEPEFGSTVVYHARDRRKSYTHCFSLLPAFKIHSPKHMVSDPVEGVDFIGSGIALYACPDDQGLATIERIELAEGLPHIVIDGKWIRDPSAFRPQLFWNGPYDKAIEYAGAMGFKEISRDTGEFYACIGNNWVGNGAGFSGGQQMTGPEYMKEANQHGIMYGGLHTLCVFLQGGLSHDVTPVPSERLQTICRTKLAKDISATDNEIVVTEPAFLAENGTWPINGSGANYIRVGTEMMMYSSISESAPWTLKGVKRGHASKPVEHMAGDELVKLQQNCYNGFVPDMKRLPDYADYYADLMARNGMELIDFDGLESTVYQNHGYYAVRIFMRRLFDTYHKLTGKYPRVTGSNVFGGAWEFMDACNVGGGNNMYNSFTGRRGTEGKDIGNGFTYSYYPGTFGIQGWHSEWSLYDAENLMAKAVGFEYTFALSTSQGAIDATGDRDEIFKAFHAWQAARAQQVFTKEQKQRLQNPDSKFHLEQTSEKTFVLYSVKEVHISESAGSEAKQIALGNPQDAQPLQFALQVDSPVSGSVITLPDGSQIKSNQKIEKGQFIVCQGNSACVAGHNRKKIANLVMARVAGLPKGESKLGVQFPMEAAAKVRFGLTVWIFGKSETLQASKN
jgi:hypothetical protein